MSQGIPVCFFICKKIVLLIKKSFSIVMKMRYLACIKYKTGRLEKCPVSGVQALFSVFIRRSTEELLENTDEVFIGKIAALFCDG